MHRSLIARPLTALSAIAATSFLMGCAPWDLSDDRPLPGVTSPDIVVAAKPPPAISGGTLLVAKDGHTAVAADPDRDRIWIVDLQSKQLVANIALQENDEPGRVVEDSAGRFHVVLRRGGAVVDIADGKIADRRDVCPAPRGIAVDDATGMLHVACLGGELITLPVAGGSAVRSLVLSASHIDNGAVLRDLQDVIVQGDKLLVTRFRNADLVEVNADGTISQGLAKPPMFNLFEQQFEPSVAWRTIKLPAGGVAMLHQRAMTTPVVIEEDGYSEGGCDGSIVHGTVTTLDVPGQVVAPVAAALPFALLPVDVAVTSDGMQFAVAAAGNSQVLVTSPMLLNSASPPPDCPDCGGEFGGGCIEPEQRHDVDGTPIAVAFMGGQVVVQTREPASIVLLGGDKIELPGESVMDTGHQMFHTNPDGASALACASCHPQGRDDGRTWNFDPIGARRTQFISGGILNTAPFHWDGDMSGMDMIMSEVFEKRMGGLHVGPRRVRVFARWIDNLPMLPAQPVPDASAVSRGQALFNDATVACASCHSGSMFTSNKAESVGTGKPFQVPSLVGISHRAPFMHDGCAKTLAERFTDTSCGGGDNHGKTTQLTAEQISDLVAYLETL